MKKLHLPVLLLAALPGFALLAADVPAAAPAKRAALAGRIDALLGPHLRPAALPVTLPNPFLVVRGSAEFSEGRDAAAARPGTDAPAPTADDGTPLSDAEFLARGLAKLKISGTMQANETIQLIINGELYKEGDHLMIEGKPAPIHVQIVRVTATELTLRYQSATQTIRVKSAPKPKDPEP